MLLVLDVPLSDTASLDAFADALHAAGAVVGAPFDHAGEDAHATAQVQRFRSDAGVTVELVDDHDAAARYVELLGPEAAVAAAAEAFHALLPVASVDALLDEARARYGDTPATLLRLALAAPLPPSPAVVAVVTEALGHARADVRLAAVEAVGLIGLPPFLDAMQRVRTEDDDAYVRGYAEQTVRMLHG